MAWDRRSFTWERKNAPQPAQEWFGVIFFSLLISFASIIPKLASGVPLKELNATATAANMTGSGWRQVR
jgi:hypothetical protein